jgi:hypothetical protein
MRAATASGASVAGSTRWSLTMNWVSRMIPSTGIANASTMTMTSCCGVLIGEEWACS